MSSDVPPPSGSTSDVIQEVKCPNTRNGAVNLQLARCSWNRGKSPHQSGVTLSHRTPRAPMLDRYGFTLNFGPAIGGSLHSHKCQDPTLSCSPHFGEELVNEAEFGLREYGHGALRISLAVLPIAAPAEVRPALPLCIWDHLTFDQRDKKTQKAATTETGGLTAIEPSLIPPPGSLTNGGHLIRMRVASKGPLC